MLNVMIVEDDVMYRYALKTVINWEQYGFTIMDEAINGKDAIIKLGANKPDILITDISMPELNGISLIKYVKENYPDIKIFVLSSYDDYKFVRDALLLGALDYILKYELEKEKLVNLLDNIKKDIEKERHTKVTIKENQLINDIITGNEIRDIKERLKEIKKGFSPGVVMNVKFKELASSKEQDNNLLFHNILDGKESKYILGINENKCCILLDIRDVKSEFKIHTFLQELSKYIIEELNKNNISNCQIGISDIFNDINRYQVYFKQAVISLEYSFYEKNKKVFFYSNDLIANKNQKLDILLNHLKENTI
uniref:response regulator n=1 Tax=Vallitalea guaymasensis TaxID=1185412 RepID=UPI00272C1B46